VDNIRYVAVARLSDRVPVAEYCVVDSRDMPKTLLDDKLEKVLRSGRVGEHTRLTITDREVGSIHYDSDPHCLYLVVCSKDYQQRMAFKFLAEVRREFESQFGDQVAAARHSSLSRPSKPILKDLCMAFNSPENVDKIASVSLQVDAVKGQMNQNIQQVLRNTENVETLLTQTDDMRNEANTFNRSAGAVKNKMWYQNLKMQILIAVLVIILVAVIVVPIVT
jgi:Synaptobrevin/Regulated-SNARE-like domain